MEMEYCAALADVGVDATAIDPTLDNGREAHRYTAVYRLGDQVCGIVSWSLYCNAAVGGPRGEAAPRH